MVSQAAENQSQRISAKQRKRNQKKASFKQASSSDVGEQLRADSCYTVSTNPTKGRCIIAARDIKVGDIVHVESPFAMQIRHEFTRSVCGHCFELLQSTATHRKECGETFFCSETCASHAPGVLGDSADDVDAFVSKAAYYDCDPDLLRLVALIVFTHLRDMEHGSSDWRRPASSDGTQILLGTFEQVRALRTHREEQSPRWLGAISTAMKALHKRLPQRLQESGGITVDALIDIACTINCNSHGLGAEGSVGTTVAVGVLPHSALTNHSCAPNCCYSYDKGLLVMRATRNIITGEELTIPYIDLYQTRDQRQEELQRTKHFKCTCERCSEPMDKSPDRYLDGVLCRSCRHGVLVPGKADNYRCDRCGRAESAKYVEVVLTEARADFDEADWLYGTGDRGRSRTLYQNAVEKHKTRLHANHVLLFSSQIPMLNCSTRQGDFKAAADICRQTIILANSVFPVSAEMANYYQTLGDVLMACSKDAPAPLQTRYRKQAREAFLECAHIRGICLGPSHFCTMDARQKCNV